MELQWVEPSSLSNLKTTSISNRKQTNIGYTTLLAVFPVSHKDVDQALYLADWIDELGGVSKYQALVVSNRLAENKARQLVDKLRKSFGQVDLYVLPTDDESGWPYSANHMFKSTAQYINNHSFYNGPWFWIEADSVPVNSNWLDRLESEYRYFKRPYMGFVHPTLRQQKESGEVFQQGEHMNGNGIYPKRAYSMIELMPSIGKTEAFDVYLQPYIVPNCHSTRLIESRWSTKNFRRDKGHIVYDRIKHGFAIIPISPDAIFVHGCKDNSLIDLYRSERKV